MNSPASNFNIGGQAVIEGVMMKGEKSISIALRKKNGEIVLKTEDRLPWTKLHPLLSLPLIRGIVTLVEILFIGFDSLIYSSEAALEEGERISGFELGISIIISLLIAVGLFIGIPAFVFAILRASNLNTIILNLIEGSIRILIFLIFLTAVSFMPDMRRIFEYHGAEHKAIHSFEVLKNKDLLTVENTKNFSTLHPGCGTAFMLIVLIVSIFVYSFLGRPSFLMRILLKLSLLPVIAGISYEIIKLARRENSPKIVQLLISPGLWLQALTTREPSPDQIEVAIKALKAVS